MSSPWEGSHSSTGIWQWLAVAVGVLLTLTELARGVSVADQMPFFIDEVVNVQAAISLFTRGDYTSAVFGGPFPPGISSGPAATWPAALPFLLRAGGLLPARLCQYVWWWLLTVGLVTAFLAREGLPWRIAFAFAAFFWALVQTLPYSQGYIQSLGEMSGAVMLGWGLFLLPEHPFFGGLALGVAVWSCKMLYLPAAVLFLLGWGWASYRGEGGQDDVARRAGAALAGFLLPLAVWLFLILLRSGWPGLVGWLQRYATFVTQGGSGLSESHDLSLAQRLRALEWRTYSLGIKVCILGSTMGSAFAGVLALCLSKRLGWTRERSAWVAAAVGATTLVTAWYFLFNPFMWIRHVQPAMLIGLGLLGFLGLEVVGRWRRVMPLVVVVLVLLTLKHTFTVLRRGPPIQGPPTYARTCRDIFGPDCASFPPVAGLAHAPQRSHAYPWASAL